MVEGKGAKLMNIPTKKKYLNWILNLSVVGMMFAMWIDVGTIASKIFWTFFWVMLLGFLEYVSIEEKANGH